MSKRQHRGLRVKPSVAIKIYQIIQNECYADAASIVVPSDTLDKIMRLARRAA